MDAPQELPIGSAVVATYGPATDDVTAAPITDGTHAWRVLKSDGTLLDPAATGTGTRDVSGAGNVYRATVPAAVTALCANGSLYYVEQTLTRSGVLVDTRWHPVTARHRGRQ